MIPFCHLTLIAQKPLPHGYPQTLKTLGDHIKKKRLDLGLSQRVVTQKLNVNERTLFQWENNIFLPSPFIVLKIIDFLGYAPYDFYQKSFGEKLAKLRQYYGLTRLELAKKLGVSKPSIKVWEANKHRPCKKHWNKLNAFFNSPLLMIEDYKK